MALRQSLQLLHIRVKGRVGHLGFCFFKIPFELAQLVLEVHSAGASAATGESLRPSAVSSDVRATSICFSSGSRVVRYWKDIAGAMRILPRIPAQEAPLMIS